MGIISAKDRYIDSDCGEAFIQTDASINKGNSGGPMFNTDGEVIIDINSVIMSPNGGNIGIAFALPSNFVKSIILKLLIDGIITHPSLGIKYNYITEKTG